MSSHVLAGIDPSLTGTAVAIGTAAASKVHQVVTRSKDYPDESLDVRMNRVEFVVDHVMGIVLPAAPALIFLEHYSFGSKNKNEYLGELGSYLRLNLREVAPVYEVAPGTLKKFVCGTGSAKKEQMIAHVFRQWQQMFPTNDHADAFGLFRMALCAAGLAEMTNKAQREAVATVVGKELLNLSAGAVPAAPF
jgi:Holliday junction resolvasome RuvABC endonuclease subunit